MTQHADLEARKKEYLQVGVVQVVNKHGDVASIKAEELENYEGRGYFTQQILYHPKEAVYPNGKAFLSCDVAAALKEGWTEAPAAEPTAKPHDKK